MRIGRVVFDGRVEPAVHHDGAWVRVGACGPDTKGMDVIDLMTRGPALREDLAGVDVEILLANGDAVGEQVAQLRQPLIGPRAIIAVGLNYRDHAQEVSWEAPPTPLLFAKWPSALTGPYDPIALDRSISTQVDYEVELAAVIGRTTLDASVETAMGHIGGFAVANDVSARDIQHSESQWTRAKSFDGFCPIGPWITTVDEIPDPQALELACSVNGARRQDASTAQMIHSVADLVAFASRATTLQPGDVLLTGTPSGVAMGAREPQWLAVGDVLRSEITGLGHLQNDIVERTAAE